MVEKTAPFLFPPYKSCTFNLLPNDTYSKDILWFEMYQGHIQESLSFIYNNAISILHIYNIYKFTNLYIHYNFTVERTSTRKPDKQFTL